MARTQKNKATEKHIGLLKAKLAKLRREILTPKSSKGGGEGFDVTKAGDTRIGLIGFPSVGKSTLLTKLTGTFSEVAAYEFTTLTCIPGVIHYKGAKIQLLDLPGIIEGAKDGKGRGRQIIGTARTCNMLMIVLDAMKPVTHKRLIEKELEGFGIRLNKQPPNIYFKMKDKGGVNLQIMSKNCELDAEIVSSILHEYKIHNADITVRCDATVDYLIDVIEGNRVYMPCLYVLNKIDQISIEELDILAEVRKLYEGDMQLEHCVPICAGREWNLDELLEKIWEYCKIIRIYTKPKVRMMSVSKRQGQIPDYEEPVILHAENPTVRDFCNRLHKDIARQFQYAWVWGSSVKYQPQRVGLDHKLCDEDVVQIVKRD